MDQQQQAGQDKPVREKEALLEARPLDEVISALEQHEGMRLFIEAIPESRSMDSKRPALKKEFLSRPDKAAAREALKAKLALWQRLVKDADSVDALLKAAQDRKKAVEKTMKANQKVALESTAELAESYISLSRFFLNIGETGEGKLHFLNAERTQIGDTAGKWFKAINEFIIEHRRQFDLANNIGGMVLPGFLGSKDAVQLYSKVAYDNLCRLYTDYRTYDTFEDYKREFAEENLAGIDKELANTVMTAIPMEGRRGDEALGVQPVYLPGSMFMAAKRYEAREKGDISQPTFGERYGSVYGASEVKLKLRQDQVEALAEMGLIVAQKTRGKVVFYGDESLHRGSKLERKKYYIVQLDDWILKVMTDYGNRRAGEKNKASMRNDVREQVQKFMNGLKAAGVIEKVVNVEVSQNSDKEDETDIKIDYVPYKAVRVFNIHAKALDGKGKGSVDKGEQ